MVVRGRLAFDDQGRLVEISEDAADPNNPEPSEIDPVKFDEIISGGVNRNGSWREGTVVRYDPRDSGPYVDGEDALSDVPSGGLLRIAATDYDVSVEGRFSTDRPVTIEGEGWDRDSVGTRLLNTGGDATDNPVIEFSNTDTQNGAAVRNIAVEHEGANSPGIRLNNMSHPDLQNVMVLLNGVGQDGIRLEGNTFYDVIEHCWVYGFSRHGIHNTAVGSAHAVRDTHAVSDAVNNPVSALKTDAVGTWVSGGEWAAVGGTGVHVNANGCLVDTGNFEDNEVAIKFGTADGTSVQRSRARQNRIHLDTNTVGYRYENTFGVTVIRPVFERAAAGGTGHEWTANASTTGAIHTGGVDKAALLSTESGVNNPYIIYLVAQTDAQISAITTDPRVDIHVSMATDHQSVPALYDSGAGAWKHLASATTPFTP